MVTWIWLKSQYTIEAGKILAASGDMALKNILPKLKDDVYKVKESIFMFLVTQKKILKSLRFRYGYLNLVEITSNSRLSFTPLSLKLFFFWLLLMII